MKTYKVSFTTELTEDDIKGIKKDYKEEGWEDKATWDKFIKDFFVEALYMSWYNFDFTIEEREV